MVVEDGLPGLPKFNIFATEKKKNGWKSKTSLSVRVPVTFQGQTVELQVGFFSLKTTFAQETPRKSAHMWGLS